MLWGIFRWSATNQFWVFEDAFSEISVAVLYVQRWEREEIGHIMAWPFEGREGWGK